MTAVTRITSLFDALEAQIGNARDAFTDSYEPEDRCEPADLLLGLTRLRGALLTLGELRTALGKQPDGDEPSDVTAMARALQSKSRGPS